MNLKDKTLAVIGLGYVGLPLAVEFGKKRPVIGFDINSDRIAELKTGFDHTLEVEADELKAASKLTYTDNPVCLRNAQVYIVTVPTPVDNAKRPDLTPLIKASETVGKVLKSGDVVIYESTVYPGATEEICVPVLEAESGLTFNTDFFCGYSPERINPGDRLHRLVNIKKVTSGSNPAAAAAIDTLYQSIVQAGTHKASSIKVAEAAKVIENTQRDLNIALVNELSLIFRRLNIDTIEVLEAAGSKWNFLPFRPGLVGGHCIGVDPYYLTHRAQELGYHPEVILAGRKINDNMAREVSRTVLQMIMKNGVNTSNATLGILGVTFKENCPDLRNSKVFDLIQEFRDWGIGVKLVDPLASPELIREGYNLELCNLSELSDLDGIIIAVAHDLFRDLRPIDFRSFCRGANPVIADLKALYSAKEMQNAGLDVFRL